MLLHLHHHHRHGGQLGHLASGMMSRLPPTSGGEQTRSVRFGRFAQHLHSPTDHPNSRQFRSFSFPRRDVIPVKCNDRRSFSFQIWTAPKLFAPFCSPSRRSEQSTNLFFYVSGQSGPFWAVLKML